MSMGAFRLSLSAEAELDAILDWSETHFHSIGRIRYATLLVQAMQDLADNPQRNGVAWVTALKRHLGMYHAWHSRNHVSDPAERVHEPRHVIVFRTSDGGVIDTWALFTTVCCAAGRCAGLSAPIQAEAVSASYPCGTSMAMQRSTRAVRSSSVALTTRSPWPNRKLYIRNA